MIIGIGMDMTEIDRVERILQGTARERFLTRVLTEGERAYLHLRGGNAAEFVAGRFAAKEALAKALGTGFGKYLSFHDLEVLADGAGRPRGRVEPSVLAGLGLAPQTVHIYISITHTRSTAGAFAVIEQERP